MKLHKANQSDWGFWESSCYFCVHGLCDVWDSDCFEFLPVIAIYKPLWNIVLCNQHWWIPDNVSQYLSQWKSRCDCVRRLIIAEGLHSVRQGWALVFDFTLSVLFLDIETHSHVSFLFWKKPANMTTWPNEVLFLDLIVFPDAQRCHWMEGVGEKY